MATFESKVSEIFDEHPRLARKMPVVIRKLFNESESEFKRRLRTTSEDEVQLAGLKLFDILYIDFYFDELSDRFLSWVIDHYPERFTDSELDEMRAQADSYRDFYEVQKVLPGQGTYIKSLITEKEGFLRDVSSSHKFVKWDVFLSRCYFIKDEYYATGAVELFNQRNKDYIVKRIKEAWSEYSSSTEKEDYAAFAKDRWDVFHQIDREIREKEKNKKFYTPYGEFQPSEVRFQVKDFLTILEKIDSLDEFYFLDKKEVRRGNKKKKTDRYSFDWVTLGIEKELEPIKVGEIEDGYMLTMEQLDADGNKMEIEALGNLYVDKSLCRLETKSVELAEFGRRHLKHLFGDALSFKKIVKMKYDLDSKEQPEEQEPEAPEFDQKKKAKILKDISKRYFLELLDQKVPALNNLTPREASRDVVARPLLIDWLKGLENLLERKRQQGEEVVSIEKIKKELGVEL